MRKWLEIKYLSLKEIKNNLIKFKIRVLLMFNIPILKIIIENIILIIKVIKKVMIVIMNFKIENIEWNIYKNL